MIDKFTPFGLERVFNVERIYTMFYMELATDFSYEGEQHDFWEMVYIDKGEMLCTADTNHFVLKSGEMTFHKPNEYHNLSGDNRVAPNVSILCFECRSRAMRNFEGKIFRLSAEEKSMLSELFTEGLACFQLKDPTNPLLPDNMLAAESTPFGGTQMVRNLLEILLIRLSRNADAIDKAQRRSYLIDGVQVPNQVKEMLDYIHNNIYGKISVRDVAQALGKGESTVKQLFALYRPNGLMKYYNSLKIKEAKKLIREGKYNMAQISDMLHFDSPQYFSKCFKSHTKMTPSEYKASILK